MFVPRNSWIYNRVNNRHQPKSFGCVPTWNWNKVLSRPKSAACMSVTGVVACMDGVSNGVIFIGWSSDIVNHRVRCTDPVISCLPSLRPATSSWRASWLQHCSCLFSFCSIYRERFIKKRNMYFVYFTYTSSYCTLAFSVHFYWLYPDYYLLILS